MGHRNLLVVQVSRLPSQTYYIVLNYRCYSFVLAISFPSLLKAFKPQGAFGYYAAWCMSVSPPLFSLRHPPV